MANFEFTSLSNQFKTSDNKEVGEVFSRLGFEETYANDEGVIIASYGEQMLDDSMHVVLDKDGKLVTVYDDYTFDELEDDIAQAIEDEDDSKYIVKDIYDYLQCMLLEGEVVLYKEVGNEKLRYTSAYGLVISRFDIKHFNLDYIMEEYAKGIEK